MLDKFSDKELDIIFISPDDFLKNQIHSNVFITSSINFLATKCYLFIGCAKNGEAFSDKKVRNLITAGKKDIKYIALDSDKKLKIFSYLDILRNGQFLNIDFESFVNHFPFIEVKIRDTKLSGEVFGKAKQKETLKLENKTYKISELVLNIGKSKKLDRVVSQVIIEDLKFLIGDLEIVYPTIPKNYNPPKDKTIKIGDIVYFKKDDRKILFKIIEIKKDNNSKKLNRRSLNNRKDFFKVQAINSGIIKYGYCENFKKYEEKNKQI